MLKNNIKSLFWIGVCLGLVISGVIEASFEKSLSVLIWLGVLGLISVGALSKWEAIKKVLKRRVKNART